MTSAGERDDEREIRDLSHRYAVALDRGDTESWAALFAEDVAFESGGTVRRREDVLAIPADQLRRYERTLHAVTTQVIARDGDRATGTVYCIAHHLYRDTHQHGRFPFDLTHAFLIRYEDEYARIDGRWVFGRRHVVTEARYVHQVIPGPPVAA
ncbi:SnoaL-like protein [Microbacterium sp. SLBN-154]|uniref:nuclear transport factor 2 family protein n=1 Tax=Microbacterium sp. SLBN-154 TaxID=2768458 RepID=UPI00116CCE49|nr:nuclear transport factor 2 family protein [Microbacterium sp. SLBN-154]TQK20390.1 SnoaL-like protein [Microbacterium sp. SLBN-154]